MASDADYAAFLDKANQDTGASAATAAQSRIGTKAVDTEVPASLRQVDEYLMSDADEPFEPVSLKWGKDSLPSQGTSFSLSKYFSTHGHGARQEASNQGGSNVRGVQPTSQN